MIEQPAGLDVFARPGRPGLVFDLPERTYHADKETLSASSAKILLGKRPPTGGGALGFGTLAHAVLLEPDVAERTYAPLDPDKIGVKADGSPAASPTSTAAWKAAVSEAQKDGKKVITVSEWDCARFMADAVRDHKEAAEILAACPHREVSAYAEAEPGVMLRGRFDLYGPNLIADYKTTDDASPEAFERKMASFGYHISAANYLWIAELLGLDVHDFKFINVERQPTLTGKYRVSVTEIGDLSIKVGRIEMERAIRRWVALGKTVDLPDYPAEAVVVDLPEWHLPAEMAI